MSKTRKYLEILTRYHKKFPVDEPDINKMIDLEKSNVDVDALIEADNETFFHDCNGIFANMNRRTMNLDNCFVPRVGFNK